MNNGESFENQSNRFLAERDRFIRDLKRAGNEKAAVLFFDESTGWAKRMQETYRDRFKQTLSYHAMIGSTPSGPTAHEDFPGEDSALVFLKGLRDRYLKQSE